MPVPPEGGVNCGGAVGVGRGAGGSNRAIEAVSSPPTAATAARDGTAIGTEIGGTSGGGAVVRGAWRADSRRSRES